MYSVAPMFFMSANWSDNLTAGACDDLLYYYAPIYILYPIFVIGIILNILNIVVFFKTKTTTIKGDMTKYLTLVHSCRVKFDPEGVFAVIIHAIKMRNLA